MNTSKSERYLTVEWLTQAVKSTWRRSDVYQAAVVYVTVAGRRMIVNSGQPMQGRDSLLRSRCPFPRQQSTLGYSGLNYGFTT